VVEFLKANKPTKPSYLRPFVYTSDLGIAPRLHDIETDFLIYGIELGDYLSPNGVSCRISSWTRQEDRSLPLRGKISGAYITSSLAKTEAVKSGFDEALLLNSRGKVSEASGMNLFIVRDSILYTPGVDQDILEALASGKGPDLFFLPDYLAYDYSNKIPLNIKFKGAENKNKEIDSIKEENTKLKAEVGKLKKMVQAFLDQA
jgi:hypothetical protein